MHFATSAELDTLLSHIDLRDPFGVRDRAMLTFARHTGLRVAELTGLDVFDVADSRGGRHSLYVRPAVAKGERGRVVPLNAVARQAVAQQLDFNRRRGFSTAPRAPLFVNRFHRRLTTRDAQRIVQALRDKAEMAVPLTPHSLRHNFASMVASLTGNIRVVQLRYDLNGRPVMQIDPLGHRQITVYDALGRVLQTVSPSGRTASRQWDALGRQVAATDPMGFSSTRLYDAAGNLLGVYDPLGRATYMTYDALNREVQRVDPSGGITSTTFDAAGQTVAVKDANGNTTAYELDLRGRVVAEIYPDGSRLSCTWDASGNMLSMQDPRTSQGPLSGLPTTYRYDAANQLVNIVLWDGAQVTLVYDGAGNVVERHDNGGDFQLVYDSMNRPQQVVQNGQVYQIHYDPDGRRLSVVFPDGRTTSAAYDDAGRLSTVVTPDLGSTLLTYDYDNRRTAVSYSNGSSALAAYDLNSRLVRLVHQNSKGTAITPDFRLTYDGVGNIVAVNDAATPLWSYSMDSLDRLISATNHTLSQTTTWTYDAVGNRLTETVGGVITNSTYNDLNQLIQIGNTKLFWDANGNLAQKYDPLAGVTTYRFDSRDRLVQVELPDAQQIVYNYDQMGRMITRTNNTGTTTFEWNGWDLEREISPSGSVTRYFYNGSEMVGFSKDDQHFKVHADWLGSVRTVTDPTGATVFTADYDPWGKQLSVTDNVPGGFMYRYVGAYGVRYDAATGLTYMRQRWYDGALQRFVSRDIFPYANRFTYAGNNPIRYVDPMGTDSPGTSTTTSQPQGQPTIPIPSATNIALWVAGLGGAYAAWYYFHPTPVVGSIQGPTGIIMGGDKKGDSNVGDTGVINTWGKGVGFPDTKERADFCAWLKEQMDKCSGADKQKYLSTWKQYCRPGQH